MGNWRSFVVRRVFGRVGIDADVLAATPGWVWPFWAERQLDPVSPAFVSVGPQPFLANVTARNWTTVGNLASPWSAIVDPRGLVTPGAGGWSLDWWVGAEDRWHLPSREAAVRQSLPDSTPVVETALRIPGGDAVQRVYAVTGTDPTFGELVVVEVENRSAVPVAVAFAVRPYNPEGLARVGNVDLVDTTVLVDGRPGVLLPRAPAGVAGSTLVAGDSAGLVLGGLAAAGPLEVEDPDGLAQAAFVYPLPHRATIRVAMPLTSGRRTSRRAGPLPRRASVPVLDTAPLPGAPEVSRGWQAQLRRGLRVELPDPRLQAAVDANRAFLLLFHTGDGMGRAEVPFREIAPMVVALDRFGFHGEAAEVLRARPWRSSRGGAGQYGHRAAHAGALWAIANHHRLAGNSGLVSELIPALREGTRLLAGQSVVSGVPYQDGFWCAAKRSSTAPGCCAWPATAPPPTRQRRPPADCATPSPRRWRAPPPASDGCRCPPRRAGISTAG